MSFFQQKKSYNLTIQLSFSGWEAESESSLIFFSNQREFI
jgi:hypothetical protein